MSEIIEACAYGHEGVCPKPWRSEGRYLVRCTKCECWLGPTRDTREGAISAWNSVMRAVRMMRGVEWIEGKGEIILGKPVMYLKEAQRDE